MKSTKILLADDHEVVTEGIRRALCEQPGFDVIGTAIDGREAVSAVKLLRPDIVIMDISMPELNGVDAALQIKKYDPGVRIVIFSMYSHTEYVIDLFNAGIAGYVLKEDSISELITAIQSTRMGGTFFTAPVQKIIREYLKDLKRGKVKPSDTFETLSLRQREVFQLLAQGFSVKHIAAKLALSAKTVESHKYNMMAKLGTRSVSDLTRMAIKMKYIQV